MLTLLRTASVLDFDKGSCSLEKIPSEYFVHILPTEDKRSASLYLNFEKVGCSLNDNSENNDGFRYHDVFHFGLATFFGWSPFVRRITRTKRKSILELDEIQDGGRALLVEESICLLAHNFALGELSGNDAVNVTKILTSHLEISAISALDWQNWFQIMKEIFLFVKEQNGVVMNCSKKHGCIEYWALDSCFAKIV